MKEITESSVVNHIIAHWSELIDEDITFFKKEVELMNDYRCDILARVIMPVENFMHHAGFIIEVKYQNPSRDLIYELTKALNFVKKHKYPNFVGVMSDDFSDPHILRFIQENDIYMWKIDVKDDDISTLTLKFIEPQEEEIQDVSE